MSSDDEISSSNDDQGDEEETSVSAAAVNSLESEYSGLDVDRILREATEGGDAETVKHAIENGANVNCYEYWVSDRDRPIEFSPLMAACSEGYDDIVRILLDAGADARKRGKSDGWSAILAACHDGHLSTVQLLINHDSGLLEFTDIDGATPLLDAVEQEHSDIVQFFLDSGADAHHADRFGETALIAACRCGRRDNARLLLALGVDVDARDGHQQTALHYAALNGWSSREIMLELILQHNANMFVVNKDGLTPFDMACSSVEVEGDVAVNPLLQVYGNKLAQDHGRLALHELLKVAQYSFAEDEELFHPPLNPLRIILPLGKLKMKYLRTLLHNLDLELLHNRDDSGKLPIHIACQTGAPVEILALILEFDPATLHMADYTGALPIHLLCGSDAAEYSSVLYLVEQGGVGTLAAPSRQGALPLHNLCESTNSSLRAVQYLMQSFPGSVAMRTNAGPYPFMLAAANDSSWASLSAMYELVRANPGLVIQR